MAGALLGLISGGALAYAAGKMGEHEQQKQQDRQLEQKTLHDIILDPSSPSFDPTAVHNPHFEKRLRKAYDNKEVADTLMFAARGLSAGKQREQQAFHAQLGQLIMGKAGGQGPQEPGGAPSPVTPSPSSAGGMLSASAPSAGPGPTPGPRPAASPEQAAPDAPVAPLDFSKQIDSLRRQQITASGNPDLSDEHKKAVGDFYEKLIKDKFEEWKASASTKEEKAAVAAAETTAREHAKLAPDITAGREAAAGRVATSRARASLSVAGSAEAMDVLKRKHDITAGGKSGSAETERKKRIDVVTALGNQYDKEHPIARLSPLGSGDARKKYIRDALGGIDPEAYLQGEGTADPSTDPATSVADKYFPKK